jgi:polysaccharide pyruvyl transferase WcaK-like protein
MTRDKYSKLQTFHFAEELKKRHVKKNLKCIIFGNFGAMNQGDEAILAGEIQELRKLPHISITAVARYPKEIKRIHQVNALSQYDFYKIRKEIKKSDFVIIGGGGLINKAERSLIGLAYQLYMLLVYFFIPRMYRKKAYIMGIGIYDNANPLIVRLALPFFRTAGFITVRDHHSQDFLKRKNVHGSLYKDNSFLMDLTPTSQAQQEPYMKEHYRKDRMNIGISLVKPDNKKDEKKLIKELTKFILSYKDQADFWFYATDANPKYFNDMMFSKVLIEEVTKHTKDQVTFHFVPMYMPPQLYFATFKMMNFIVAMRFHAAVFAYRSKIPFAGISYDKKCTSFIESVGQQPIQIKDVTSEKIKSHIL